MLNCYPISLYLPRTVIRAPTTLHHSSRRILHQTPFHTRRQVKFQPIGHSLLSFSPFVLAVRPATPASTIQFTTNNTVRPLIFHQKTNSNSSQPQLLTVMPASVRLQQLTPVVRAPTAQPTTIVRLMPPTSTPTTSTTGTQQIIQLNANKQTNQPLVIKAITTQASNRQQQQPIFLTTTAQQKTLLGQPGQQQQQQQVLVLNQNAFANPNGQTTKFTLQMTHADTTRPESNSDPGIPQLDGSVDDQVR